MPIPPGPALGVIELCAVTRGLRVVDAAVKKAPVQVLEAAAIMPGKFFLRLGGGVDEVYEALQAGREAAGDTLIDHLLLPYPHDELVQALAAPLDPALQALGALEAYSLTAALRGADAALKAAEVSALRFARAPELGGKAAFYLTGALHDVEAAVEAGADAIGGGLLVGTEIIANPHPQLIP